ncbi:uncharacterized protein ACIBXB_004063 isoform 2-T6 [Morphnus guianensis]
MAPLPVAVPPPRRRHTSWAVHARPWTAHRSFRRARGRSHSVFRSVGLCAHSALRTLWSCGESRWALEQNFGTASMGGGQLVVASMPRSAGGCQVPAFHRSCPFFCRESTRQMERFRSGLQVQGFPRKHQQPCN